MTIFELASRLMEVAADSPLLPVKIWDADMAEYTSVEEISIQREDDAGIDFVCIEWEKL